MTEVPVLRGDGVLLRAHTEDDLPGVIEQCQDPDMQRFTTIPVPYGPDDARWFLDHVAEGWRAGTAASWAIEVDGRFAGTVDLSFGEGWASIGYGLHPGARGRGVMTTAVELVLDWGFTERGLLGVRWEAFVGNHPSRRVAEKNGFTIEGTARGMCVVRGMRHDAWIGSLLAAEHRTAAGVSAQAGARWRRGTGLE